MKENALNAATEPRFLYVHTFGCQMNEYDTLRVQRILALEGYTHTEDLNIADVVFLNTCSVREKAEQKVHSFLGRLRRLKARNPDVKIIVAGCVAQQLGRQLLERFDHLDLIIGTKAISSIAQLLEKVQVKSARIAHIPEHEEAASYSEPFDDLLFIPSDVAAPVTIMQGCDNFCTYCIVPHVRGRERSRPSDDILREIRLLVAGGAKEILLLGQNVNSYGRGLKENFTFVDLLRRIQAETDVTRLRFTTSHPKDLTDELIQCFADLPRLCKYLHIPFQAGSDRVLRMMNRRYTASQYIEKIERLRQACPEIGISSDAMVGFPGETEEDYRETLALIETVQFDNLFSFRYSDRPYAKSCGFPDKLSEEVKVRRLIELQALQAEITLRKNEAEVGHVREILVEGRSKTSNEQLSGRTHQNRIVHFEGPDDLIGKIIQVEIVGAFSHSLKGEVFSGQGVAESHVQV